MWDIADLKPTLEGSIVRLEPLAPRHRDGLGAVAGPPEIWRWWPFEAGRDEAAFDAWWGRALAAPGKGCASHFATIAQSTGEPIGSTSFTTPRPEHRGIEIGWTWLTPAAWGTGANTEAKLLQLTYAFETLQCIRVEFDTDEQNARSRAALAALPAHLDGVLRDLTIHTENGRRCSSAYYSILDHEWPAVKRNLEARVAARVTL